MDDTLDTLTNLEHSFYQSGFEDGFDHGRVHGLIEGRALGREKGFELMEEVGYYKGFALLWSSTLVSSADEKQSRAVRHAVQLLQLIAEYPRQNPSHLNSKGIHEEASNDLRNPLDLTKIRSKYRLLCASLSVPPRLARSPSSLTVQGSSELNYLNDGPGVLVEYEAEVNGQHPQFRSKSAQVNRIWKID